MMPTPRPTTPNTREKEMLRITLEMPDGTKRGVLQDISAISSHAIGDAVRFTIDQYRGHLYEAQVPAPLKPEPEPVWPKVGDTLTNERLYPGQTFEVMTMDPATPAAVVVAHPVTSSEDAIKVPLPLRAGWAKSVTASNGSAVESDAAPHIVHAVVSAAVDRYVTEKHAKLSAIMRAQVAGAIKKMISPNINAITFDQVALYDAARLGRGPVPVSEDAPTTPTAHLYGDKHLMVSNHVEAKYLNQTEERRLSIYNALLAMMDEGVVNCTPAFVADLDGKRLNGPLREAATGSPSVLPDFKKAHEQLVHWQEVVPQDEPGNVTLGRASTWIRQQLRSAIMDVEAGRTPTKLAIALGEIWEVAR